MMVFSEIVVLLLIYSGLLIFFLLPFQRQVQSKNHQRNQKSFLSVFKDNLVNMVFHKKAILALVLLGFALISIQAGYAGAQWHYNAHSGYPPISNNLTALYTICGVVIYTVVLLLFLVYKRTLKIVKSAK